MTRTRRVLLAMGLLGAAGAVFAQGGAPITSVVLYPGSATILRSGQVEAGATQLVIPNITAAFPTRTMRVDADPGIHIGQVETRDAGQVVSGNPEQAALEARMEALKDQVAALDAQSQAAGIVKSYLERLGGDAATPADRARAPADAKALAGVIDAIDHGASDVLARMQRLALQKRDLEKKLAALQRDLARLQGDNRDTRTVVINLTATRGGSVRLSYQLPSAGWMPGYRAELDSKGSTVQLVRTAELSQKTGEDWKGVHLLLSTSQPRLSPQAPSPQPWLLTYEASDARDRRPDAVALQEAKKVYRMAAPLAAAPAPAAPMEAQDAYVPPSFQNEGSYETEFEISAPVTLAADGKEISLELSGQRLDVRQRLQIAPRIERTATITAEAPRPAGVWLPGNLQLYRDGSYVGATAWNPQAAQKLALCFGRDELVRVTLDRVKGDQGDAGVFDRRTRRTIADVMSIHSRHAAPVDVLVLEATPVSTAEEITVTSRFDPEPTVRAWEQRRGVVGWEKTLRPDETAQIRVDYLIEYPKEGVVPGLGF